MWIVCFGSALIPATMGFFFYWFVKPVSHEPENSFLDWFWFGAPDIFLMLRAQYNL